MSEFLFLFRGGADMDHKSPESMQGHLQKWVNWIQRLSQEGKVTAGQPLNATGKVVTGSKKIITDGPFAEGKEIVGGYLMVKAADLAEATELSKDCPIFEYDGTVEVRQIEYLHI